MPTDTPITNPVATETASNYEICQRTGFRVEAGKLVREWTGLYVRPESYEPHNVLDLQRISGMEKAHFPGNPEPDDAFIENKFPGGVSSDSL